MSFCFKVKFTLVAHLQMQQARKIYRKETIHTINHIYYKPYIL